MSTKDQILSTRLNGEALLRAPVDHLPPSPTSCDPGPEGGPSRVESGGRERSGAPLTGVNGGPTIPHIEEGCIAHILHAAPSFQDQEPVTRGYAVALDSESTCLP